jgi:hypothetical protein
MKHLDWGPDIKGDKKDKLRTRTKRDCYNCRKYGYFIANCPYEHRDDDDDKKKKKEMGYKRDKNYKKKPYYGEAYFDKEWDLDEERSDFDSDGVATMAIKGSSSSSSKSLFLNLNIEKHNYLMAEESRRRVKSKYSPPKYVYRYEEIDSSDDEDEESLLCHTQFLCQNQVLIVCMIQDQLFHTYGQKCS